jgi:hypothetical protein
VKARSKAPGKKLQSGSGLDDEVDDAVDETEEVDGAETTEQSKFPHFSEMSWLDSHLEDREG